MRDIKDMFMDAHEQLIEEYLERHPHASEAEAYKATANRAYNRMTDNLADRADYYRQKAKDDGL